MTPRERPILFCGPMVRAVLAGTKTQTRRPVKPQPPDDHVPIRCGLYSPCVVDRHGEERPGPEVFGAYDDEGGWGMRCPYGGPGDRLWVREVYALLSLPGYPPVYVYAAEGRTADGAPLPSGVRWHSPIHMPRRASRLTLDVVSVRIERVRSIADTDIAAEGMTAEAVEALVQTTPRAPQRAGMDLVHSRLAEPGYRWRLAWSLIYGHASWRADPWCWAITFRRAEVAYA